MKNKKLKIEDLVIGETYKISFTERDYPGFPKECYYSGIGSLREISPRMYEEETLKFELPGTDENNDQLGWFGIYNISEIYPKKRIITVQIPAEKKYIVVNYALVNFSLIKNFKDGDGYTVAIADTPFSIAGSHNGCHITFCDTREEARYLLKTRGIRCECIWSVYIDSKTNEIVQWIKKHS